MSGKVLLNIFEKKGKLKKRLNCCFTIAVSQKGIKFCVLDGLQLMYCFLRI